MMASTARGPTTPPRPRARAPWRLLTSALGERDEARQLAIIDHIAPYLEGLSAQEARVMVCRIASAMWVMRDQWEQTAEACAPDRATDGSFVFTSSDGTRVTLA